MLNALGNPSPNRTDFSRWSRSNLEQFARHAADENLLLREQLRLALEQAQPDAVLGALAPSWMRKEDESRRAQEGRQWGHMGHIIQDQQDAARAAREKREAQDRQEALRARGAGQMREAYQGTSGTDSNRVGAGQVNMQGSLRSQYGHDGPGGEIRGQGFGDHTPLR
jgi:hypothetical protein